MSSFLIHSPETRQRMLRIALASALALALGACGGSGNGGTAGQASTVSDDSGQTSQGNTGPVVDVTTISPEPAFLKRTCGSRMGPQLHCPGNTDGST